MPKFLTKIEGETEIRFHKERKEFKCRKKSFQNITSSFQVNSKINLELVLKWKCFPKTWTIFNFQIIKRKFHSIMRKFQFINNKTNRNIDLLIILLTESFWDNFKWKDCPFSKLLRPAVRLKNANLIKMVQIKWQTTSYWFGWSQII